MLGRKKQNCFDYVMKLQRASQASPQQRMDKTQWDELGGDLPLYTVQHGAAVCSSLAIAYMLML